MTLNLLACLLQAVTGAADAAVSGPAPVPRFFARPLDYWQQNLRYPEPAAPHAPGSPNGSSEWGQVVKLPDGSLRFQELPLPLVRVLEDPTPGHLRAYFEWKLGRTRKILRAAELMKEYRATLGGAGLEGSPGLIGENPTALLQAALRAPSPASGVPSTATPPSPLRPACGEQALLPGGAPPGIKRVEPFRLLYFRRDGCPPCTLQDPILANWLASHPETRLEKLAFGEQPELWRAHRVRGTPSLVLLDEETGQSVFREGLQDLAQLEAALAKIREKGPPR